MSRWIIPIIRMISPNYGCEDAFLVRERYATKSYNSIEYRVAYPTTYVDNTTCDGTSSVRNQFIKQTQLVMSTTASWERCVYVYIN